MVENPNNQNSLEIKVVTPQQRGDNVADPAAAAAAKTTTTRRKRSSTTSDPSGPPRRPEEMDDFKPFKRYTPWLVSGFIVANIIMFTITMGINNCPQNPATHCIGEFLGRFSFQPMKENPLLGPSSITLVKMGALQVDWVVKKHEVWRLFTCIWLHAGLFHVFANMLSLVFIGIRLEQEFGFVRIGFLYFFSGFGGSLLSGLFIRQQISVGASGALFGLLGAMLSELIVNWTIYENKLAAFVFLGIIIVINLAMGILPHVDNFAHIGGFISGFLLGFVFLIRPHFGWVSQKNAPPGHITTTAESKHMTYQLVLWGVSLVLLIVGFIAGLVTLLKGVDLNDHCSWCHYLSCVPTSLWNCRAREVYCQSTHMRNQLNMTCISSGKSNLYPLSVDNPSQLQQLCSELCS